MSENLQGANGTPTDPSMVDQGNLSSQPMADETPKGDTVKYESYRKVVGQNKRIADENATLREQLEKIEADRKAASEAKLVEQNEWKTLAEQRAEEAKAAREEANQLKSQQVNARKLDAVLKKANVKRKFWNMVDLDAVILNPETGDVEDSTILKEVERLSREFPEVLESANGPKLDNSAPIPNTNGSLTIEKYAQMTAKEKAANINNIEGVPEWMLKGNSRKQ